MSQYTIKGYLMVGFEPGTALVKRLVAGENVARALRHEDPASPLFRMMAARSNGSSVEGFYRVNLSNGLSGLGDADYEVWRLTSGGTDRALTDGARSLAIPKSTGDLSVPAGTLSPGRDVIQAVTRHGSFLLDETANPFGKFTGKAYDADSSTWTGDFQPVSEADATALKNTVTHSLTTLDVGSLRAITKQHGYRRNEFGTETFEDMMIFPPPDKAPLQVGGNQIRCIVPHVDNRLAYTGRTRYGSYDHVPALWLLDDQGRAVLHEATTVMTDRGASMIADKAYQQVHLFDAGQFQNLHSAQTLTPETATRTLSTSDPQIAEMMDRTLDAAQAHIEHHQLPQ